MQKSFFRRHDTTLFHSKIRQKMNPLRGQEVRHNQEITPFLLERII